MLKQTPFHRRAQALNQAWDWRPWSGYVVASKYEMTHLREYYAIRNTAGLLDISPLYKYLIEGPDALKLLRHILVRDPQTCQIGQAQYTCWCDEHGYVLEDGVLFRLGADRFRLTTAEPNLHYLLEQAWGLRVAISDISEMYGILAVQGPRARAVLEAALASPAERTKLVDLKYFWLAELTLAGNQVMVSRTGYTGDLGYEIWLPAAAAETIWDHLMAAGAPLGLTPAGMLALDMTRVEAGLLLLEVDYNSARFALIPGQKSTPLELGFGWMLRGLARDERRFIGRTAIEQELQRGSRWAFMGLAIEWDAYERSFAAVGLPAQAAFTPQRESIPIYHQGAYVGYATTTTYSPLLKKHLALATILPEQAAPGNQVALEITVEHQRLSAEATVVELPFFNPPRKRQ